MAVGVGNLSDPVHCQVGAGSVLQFHWSFVVVAYSLASFSLEFVLLFRAWAPLVVVSSSLLAHVKKWYRLHLNVKQFGLLLCVLAIGLK